MRQYILLYTAVLLVLPIALQAQSWDRTGNNITGTDFIGVLNGQDFIIKTTPAGSTVPIEHLRITNDGNMGFGTMPSGLWGSRIFQFQSSAPELRISGTGSTMSFFSTAGNNFIHSSSPLHLLLDSVQGAGFTISKRNNNNIYDTGDVTDLLNLDADGKLFVRGLKVTVDSFPDYVFRKDYQLMSLNDLKHYIEENHHLPGFLPALKVETDGLDVGDASRLMLRKIEELTLYIISLQEEIDGLKKQMQQK